MNLYIKYYLLRTVFFHFYRVLFIKTFIIFIKTSFMFISNHHQVKINKYRYIMVSKIKNYMCYLFFYLIFDFTYLGNIINFDLMILMILKKNI